MKRRHRKSNPAQLPAKPALDESAATQVAPSAAPRPGLRRLAAALVTGGVLAAVVSFVLTTYYPVITDWLDRRDPIAVVIDDRGGFDGRQGTIWALESVPPQPVGNVAPLSGDAVGVNQAVIGVTLDNVKGKPVIISSFEAIVHDRRPPLTGAILAVKRGGGGGGPPPVNLGFALDTSDLQGRTIESGQPGATHYLDKHSVTLAPGEQLQLRLAGHSATSHVRWSVIIGYVVQGKKYTIHIGSAEQPFIVTAASVAYTKAYWAMGSGLEEVGVTEFCKGDCLTLDLDF